MKRSILAIAIASFCAAPLVAGAQGFGIKGGLSYGSVPNNNGALPGNLSPHDGFALGIGASTGGVVGFGVEGLYAQRGFTSSVTGFSQQLSYIDVPLYLKVTLPTGMIRPYALVGPQVSFEMNCDAGGSGSCPSGRDKVTYAGVIGAGVRFGVWTGVSVEGRYQYGLSNLNYNTVSNSSSYRPRSFMLLAGIGF
jgi:opacity protein-like surface antigen